MAGRPDYRRVTKVCAKRDWSKCKSHADVVKLHGSTDLLTQFCTADNPASWYAGEEPRIRTLGLTKGQAKPGTRVIGQVKTKGFRGWVWHDDGSVFDLKTAFQGFDLHWMIAFGNRAKGDKKDLQTKRLDVLHDPHDSWRPDDDDYAEFFELHREGFYERASSAVHEAVGEAATHPNTVIPIRAVELDGSVVHEHDEDVIEGVVVAETNELWVLLSKERKNGRPLLHADAHIIAADAYPDDTYPQQVFETYDIRDGLVTADPDTHHVFYAELA